MKRLALALAALWLTALAAPSLAGAVDLDEFDVVFLDSEGKEAMAAGAHPFELRTSFEVDTEEDPPGSGEVFPVEAVKDLLVEQVPGLAGTPAALERCEAADFLESEGEASFGTGCSDEAAVGTVKSEIGEAGQTVTYASPVYNLEPSPGFAAKLGFRVTLVRVTVDIGLSESSPHRIEALLRNVSQGLEFFSTEFSIWGTPADAGHDPLRGKCLRSTPDEETGELRSTGDCPTEAPAAAFLANPRSCTGPLATLWQTTSWQNPAAPPGSGSVLTHDNSGSPRGFSGCAELPFSPELSVQPTAEDAQSATGLEVKVQVPHNEGLTDPAGRAAADIRRVSLALPRGMTVNPSQAEGLKTCDEDDLAEESAASGPARGCPPESKIGTVEVKTPLLPEEDFEGELFVATPYENPFDSLLALYMTVKNPARGVAVSLAGRVDPDPEDGRLIATFGVPSAADPAFRSLPQLPFSSVRVRLREGARSPLITPPGCGRFTARASFVPWSGTGAEPDSSRFSIDSGVGGGRCPGATPFEPGFEAGTLNNAAGAFSPFAMRIARPDGHQDLARFSAVLPAGVAGVLAAIPPCPEAAIARARGRTGQDGGRDELRDPSCPAASQIGRTLAGAGVGSQLTYVGGALYLAGPYNGAPLSVVSVTPAVAGPFDAGTVVVRVALRVNPTTARAEADGAASDPIPHILKGIPLNVRDLRVFAERPGFTFNATSCARQETLATLWGAGTALDPSFPAPVGRTAPYQAASCAALGFKPKLAIRLRGGTRRGAHPALRAIVTPRPGDANFSRAVVTLPRSAFLEQGHIRTVCTRVQFASPPGHGANCPPGAVYGRARAWSPILDAPAQGPVFLRSSDNKLPDLVIALTGPPSAAAQVELSARIDSVRGGIRSTFAALPDLPVSRFILEMQGARKGLIVNSRNLCRKPRRNRAKANLRGQNGRLARSAPVVGAAGCRKGRGGAKRR